MVTYGSSRSTSDALDNTVGMPRSGIGETLFSQSLKASPAHNDLPHRGSLKGRSQNLLSTAAKKVVLRYLLFRSHIYLHMTLLTCLLIH